MNRFGNQVPIPLYHQIKTYLTDALENGQLKPGDRVPSERELTTRFSVSRMTARQALTELEAQGLLVRVQGRGTFAATPKIEQPLVGLTSFTEDMRRRGLQPASQILAVAERPAGRRIAGILGIAETAVVLRMERLRLAGGEPMAVETAHIPTALVPGLCEADLAGGSLYVVLRERYGLHLVRATESLEATPADSYVAGLLHVREGTPVLLRERVCRDPRDRIVEFVRSIYRGDRYRFVTELTRHPEGRG